MVGESLPLLNTLLLALRGQDGVWDPVSVVDVVLAFGAADEVDGGGIVLQYFRVDLHGKLPQRHLGWVWSFLMRRDS